MTCFCAPTTDGIATLTLNAPASLNALSDAMLAALKAEFARLGEDSTIRVVILKGAGKAFCAGHDLKEMQRGREAPDKGRAYFADLFARCAEVMQMIPRPAAAGDRRGARHRHRRRLPVRRLLRHGGRGRGHALRRQRREYRALLLDPDGRASAQRARARSRSRC